MDIQALKIQFLQEFLKVRDKQVIKKLSKLLHEEQMKCKKYELTNEEVNAVEEGLQDFEKGNTYSHEEVMSEMKAKYPNLFK
ncbi:hypothetical protein DMA11_13890 [Marinilabiliaceae bacterium JC017]|nr:hypothetical protein DMA11_13890 [Marinilabiliaceae bacterium JC017]